jgi:hypothetical protein
MMGGPAPGAARFTAECSAALWKSRGLASRQGFLMIAKGFIPGMGAKSFAIMKDGWEYEFSGVAGAGVTMDATPGRRPSW